MPPEVTPAREIIEVKDTGNMGPTAELKKWRVATLKHTILSVGCQSEGIAGKPLE